MVLELRPKRRPATEGPRRCRCRSIVPRRAPARRRRGAPISLSRRARRTLRIGRPSRSRARSSRAWDRRPGSSTKLASIESYATPPSSTPARRNTSQSYLMLWPALRTPGSSSSARSGPTASLPGGGRFLGGVSPASSPSGATWANGRYHARPAIASDRPTSSARIGSSEEVSVSRATMAAARHAATTAPSDAGSSTITDRRAPGPEPPGRGELTRRALKAAAAAPWGARPIAESASGIPAR